MIKLRRLATLDAGFDQALLRLTAFENAQDAGIDAQVAHIIEQVRTRGDEALLEFTRRFDGLDVQHAAELELGPDLLQAALNSIPPEQRAALEAAAQRVRAFHERQKLEGWVFEEPDGTRLGQQVTALDRVGIYVPGGKAAYPSSVLMNAIPAQVAGVAEIIMVVPTPQGVRNPLVLAAAAIAGVTRVFTVGGAQAVAALAYGTATIPAVDKIVGPGNAWVAAAKRRVFGVVGIDMVAGPSEILVITDGSPDPDWVAMDLFSQAEHDEMAQSLLLCPHQNYLDQVEQAINRLLPTMERAEVIKASLEGRGALIHTQSLEQACTIANQIAPEHLELSVADSEALLPHIKHAGAIFMGHYSSEALGDYCAGPNHVLPTGRTARFASPLGVYDFQKRSSLIRISARGSETLGKIASILARGEGLEAHARSAEYRLRKA
jgi:histidinol dehydrogenase